MESSKIKEEELEARKKPATNFMGKMKSAAAAPDWKKLLIGLATMGAAFGIAKALSFWKEEIIPAGGFQEWWKNEMWPTITTKLEGWMDLIIPAFVQSGADALVAYINENKEAWKTSAKTMLGDIPRKIFDTVLGIQIGGLVGAKLGGIIGTAFMGPGFGTMAGALVGAAVGMAVGGIAMYFKGQGIYSAIGTASRGLGAMFSLKMTKEKWGAALGAVAAIGMLAAIPTGGLSLVAMIAIVALAAGIGAVLTYLGLKKPTPLAEGDVKKLDALTNAADDATKSWLERNVFDRITAATNALNLHSSNERTHHGVSMNVDYGKVGRERFMQMQREYGALYAGGEFGPKGILGRAGQLKGDQTNFLTRSAGNGPHHGSTQGKEGEDWYIDENGVFTIIINTGKKSSKRSGPSTRTGENPIEQVIGNSLPHIKTDLGQALKISHGVFPASIPPVASSIIGGGAGSVDFNSMANVNTTNISQANTRDVGMALAFTKTKNSRLGYAVS